MKFTDIIELAKQGYKPNDIKELLELSKATEDAQKDDLSNDDNTQKTPEKDPEHDVSEDKTPDVSKDKTPDVPGEDDKDKALDYKSLYEAEKTKNATLQKMVMKVDISGSDNKSDQDIFTEVMKDFM